MSAQTSVVFAWPGDLHLEEPDRDNVRVAKWMVDEVNSLGPDFLQFAGDNVQHARDVEFAMFREVRAGLTVPWHALVGDHDAHHDPAAHAHRVNVGEPYGAFSLAGYRFIKLNTMEFKPLGITPAQVLWFRYEVDAALARGEKVVVFQHHYPFKVCETFDGPGIAEWREIVQTRRVEAIFCGHTHYGQCANDGRNVYVATRSIGEPEGGAAGFAVVYLGGDDFALTYREYQAKGPVVLITHPRRLILCTSPRHVVAGPDELRVRVWSSQAVTSVEARLDEGAWEAMTLADDGFWRWPIPGDRLAKGERVVEVRATDADGTGRDSLSFQVDRSGRFTAVPRVDPIVKSTKFC